MTRKRYKKSHIKTQLPALQQQAPKASPAAQVVLNRIASGGVEYLMQNAIRIMTDSEKLAEEPEFIDFNLDGVKAANVSQRWLKKYEKRLAEAKIKSSDEYHEVYDEMRIEVITELATPAFRKEVDERLQIILDRLMASDDLEKLEMVLLLKPLLGLKSVPWGICGLILAIYNRSLQQTLQEYEAEVNVYDAVVEALQEDGEEKIDVNKLSETPGKLEQLAKRFFTAKPGLRERAEKQILNMIDAFEKELAEGKITLDLFTQEELVLPFQRLQAEFGEPFTQVQPSEAMRQRVLDAIRQAINEMMTPERFRRLYKDVQSMSKTWMRERKKWAAALRGELIWLDEEQYEENKFVIAAFLGQITRLGNDQKPAQKQTKHNV
jgi:hypothetical protein